MDAVLDRLPRLGAWPRRLAITACLLIAVMSLVPGRGRSQAAHRTVAVRVPPGSVATSVSIDAGAASLVHEGDRVDLVDAGPRDPGGATNSARVIASAVRVLSVSPQASFGTQTRQLLVATDRATAVRLASTQGRRVLAVIALPP